MAENDDYDDAERPAGRPKRAGHPRLGSFVTIATAILLLFGAATSVGKVPEVAGLFNIDQAQERRNQGERLQDERLKTIITLGAMPAPVEELRPRNGSLPLDHDVLPPRRPEVDVDSVRQSLRPQPMSIRTQNGGPEEPEPGRDDRDLPAAGRDTPRSGAYVVAADDTWIKIAKKTTGDASRWQDILAANPSAKAGLRVGMRLVIP